MDSRRALLLRGVFLAVSLSLAVKAQSGKGRDLVIAIDTTASMSNTIEAVQKKCVELVNYAMQPGVLTNPPSRFVLAAFNDPDIIPAKAYTDKTAFIRDINALRAEGGGDLPELCLEGIETASDNSGRQAIIHVFTDARTKNPQHLQRVLRKVNLKDQTVMFVIPNPSIKRADVPEYATLSRDSGGSLYITGTSMADIANTLHELSGSSDLDTVTVKQITKSDTASKRLTVAVDSAMRMIDVVLTDDNSVPSAVFYPPHGARTGRAELIVDSVNTKVYRILNPAPGEWTVDVTGTAPGWDAIVRGRSPLDFAYAIGQLTSAGFQEMPGSPGSGDRAVIMLTPSCDDCVVSGVSFVGTSGAVYGQPSVTFHPVTASYSATLLVPSEPFFVKINGNDKEGNAFERMHRTAVQPSLLRVEVVSGAETPEEVQPGETVQVEYAITNHGASAVFERTVSGDAAVSSASPSSVDVPTGQRVNGYVELQVLDTAMLGSSMEILIMISAPSTSTTNYIRKVIQVTDSGPTCKITFSNLAENCQDVGNDPAACRNHRYKVEATFGDKEKGLRTVQLKRDKWVGLATWSLPDEVWRLSSESVSGIATGNCCTRAVSFLVSNANKETTRCVVRR